MDVTKRRDMPEEVQAKVRPRAATVARMSDPWEVLRQSDQALAVFANEAERFAGLRRKAAMTLVDEHGVPPSEVAEVLATTPTRVRQLVIQARNEYGRPTREQRGGHRADPRAPEVKERLKALRKDKPEVYDRIQDQIAAIVAEAAASKAAPPAEPKPKARAKAKKK